VPEEDGSSTPSGNPDNQAPAQNPSADLPKKGVVSNNGASDPDGDTDDSEKPSGKVHWVNHATFYLSVILAVLTLGTLRVYWLQLRQMQKQTASAEASSYAAWMTNTSPK